MLRTAILTTTGQAVIVSNHIKRRGYRLVYVPYSDSELLHRRLNNNQKWHSARLVRESKIDFGGEDDSTIVFKIISTLAA